MSIPSSANVIRFSIEKSLKDLPALPTVVGQVLKETESPTASADTIERLISSDQALASKVLRVVNSAYYGLSGQVTNLSQAIVILGLQQVRNLVLGVAAVSSMKPRSPRQEEVLQQFWLHSFSAAATTQILSRRLKFSQKDAELMFIGGLLHDIGRLFLFSNFTQTFDQVLRFAVENELSLEASEQKFLGMTHADVGQLMVEKWKLPEQLAQVVGQHEGPFSEDASPVTLGVHVADVFNKTMYYTSDATPDISISPVAQQWLNMSEQEKEELDALIAERREAASALYGLMAA
jgi:putative nucleotidyltransferase with HDIG domain